MSRRPPPPSGNYRPPPPRAPRAPQPPPRAPQPPPRSFPVGSVLAGLAGGVVLLGLVIGILLLRPAAPSGGGAPAAAIPTATSAPAGPASAVTPGGMQASDATVAPATTAQGTPIAGLTAVSGLDRNHTKDPVTYAQVPPLGGPHFDQWQNCGVYDQPIKNEYGVHSLEHGAIWITYRPDLPMAQVNALRGLTHQSNYRLLSPYPGLPHPIVVSAWGYQLPLETADDPRLNAFIANFQQNPNGPEPGASCSGSNGTPLP